MTGPSFAISTVIRRSEAASSHLDALGCERVAEGLVERFGRVRRGRGGEAGSVPFGRVRNERELADDEGSSTLVQNAPVELPLVVLEDPQAGDLPGQPPGDGRVVAARDAEEHAEPAADLADRLAVHEDPGAGHPLHDRPHGSPR